jgi:hypothetical protein
MLTIRQDQMNALEVTAQRRFEGDMVAHVKEFAPRLYEIRGEQCIGEVVRTGVKKASGYGLTNRGPARLYIELMLSLGCHFDSDPQYNWARNILADQSGIDQMARAALLYRRTNDYFDAVMGDDNEHAMRALRRIASTSIEEIVNGDEGSPRDAAVRALRSMYPQKAAYVGDEALAVLVEAGIALADRHGIGTTQGQALLIGLMYGFGHGVTGDPLYPWIGETLDPSKVTDPDLRVRRLHARTMTYLAGIVRHFGEID